MVPATAVIPYGMILLSDRGIAPFYQGRIIGNGA